MAARTDGDPIYRPLKEDQIRLMRINHSGGPLIECELGTFSLQERPHYTALSYCWTKAEASHEIRLNGQPFWVRPNLHAYLEIMSEEHHTCWIFIDALCINQENIQERGHQVKLMREIYRDAEEVIGWLNTRLDHRLNRLDQDQLEGLYDALQAMCDSEEVLSAVFGEGRGSTSTSLDTLFDILITSFFETECWSRIWIVEEVILARVFTLRTHRLRIRSEELKALNTHTLRHHNVPNVVNDLTDPLVSFSRPKVLGETVRRDRTIVRCPNPDFWIVKATMVIHLMDLWRKTDASGQTVCATRLIDVMLGFSSQACSETFDIVFGLLGLTNSQLEPDYNMSKLELFLRILVETVIEETRYSQLQAIKPHSEHPDWMRESVAAAVLMHNLRLDAFDPVVTLTMGNVLECCRRLLGGPEVSASYILGLVLDKTIVATYRSRGLPTIAWVTRKLQSLLTISIYWLRSKLTAFRLHISRRRGITLASPCDPADTRTVKEWMDIATSLVTEIASKGEAILERKYKEKKAECEAQILKLRTLATKFKDDEALRDIDEMQRTVDDVHAKMGEDIIDKGALYIWSVEFYTQMIETVQAHERTVA